MRNFFFWVLAIFAVLLALAVVPGLDFLAWHFMHPTGFWERIMLVIVEMATLWPRLLFAFIMWAIVSKIALIVAD